MTEEIKASETYSDGTEDVKKLSETIEGLKAEIEALKSARDSASSDAADWKKKYRSTLDEAQRKEAERNDTLTELKNEIAGYKKREMVSGYTSKLMEAGYDSETAKNMAPVLPPDLDDSFFAGQKSFLEAQKQKFKAESLNAQPSLSTGLPMSGKTAEQLENEKMRSYFGLPTK